MSARANYLIIAFAIAVNLYVGIPKLMVGNAWGWMSIFAALVVFGAGAYRFVVERRSARFYKAAMAEARLMLRARGRSGDEIAAELREMSKACGDSLGLSRAMQCERGHHSRVAIGGGGHFGDDLLTCVDCGMEKYDGSWEGHTIGEVRDRLLGSDGTYEPVRAEDWERMKPTSRPVISL